MAYCQGCADTERQLAETRGLVRDLTAALEKRNVAYEKAHTTGLREGLRQAAARLEALIAGATNPTLRDFECLHAELLSDAAPTEVTRG